MYIQVVNGSAQPHGGPSQLRQDHKHISFPFNISKTILAEFDVFVVAAEPEPTFSTLTHRLESGEYYNNADGTWGRGWNVVALSAEEAAVCRAIRQSEIKAHAKQLIENIYPDWKQRNINAQATALLNARLTNGSWTDEEQAMATALEEVWAWVKAVRAASDVLEVSVPDDFTDAKHWPAKPG